MKRYVCTLLLSVFFGALAVLSAAAESAIVQAWPSTAAVLVDGREVSFQAYEIDGYHYFKIRDLAAAFTGTRQQFVPKGNGSGAALFKSFGEFEKYQSVGDELQAGDGMLKEAVPVSLFLYTDLTRSTGGLYTSMHPLYAEIVPYVVDGYTIEDYNYIKLRDMADVFDFGVRWDGAQSRIEIDTELPYVLSDYTPPARTDTMTEAGWAYESEKMAFINEMPILSYVVDAGQGREEEIIYVVAEDLENYGFDVGWDEGTKTLSLQYREGKTFALMDGEIINAVRGDAPLFPVYTDNVRVRLDGREVGAYSLNGRMLIPLAELYPYGIFSYSLYPDLSENPVGGRVNLDMMRMELSKEFEALDRSKLKYAELKNYYEHPDLPRSFSSLNAGNYPWGDVYYQEDSNGLMNGMVSFELDCNEHDPYIYKFLGHFSNDKKSGEGVYYMRFYDGWAMYGAAETNAFQRGIFQDGSLYDGIQYESANMHGRSGSRKEGAMVNGYQRQSIVECRPQAQYRFGYRILCEGEVQDGEFCGYYRSYGDDGRLVFEGQYTDYLAQTAQ